MDIKEIVLKVASELDFSGPIAISPLPDHLYIDFAEALIAELAKYHDAPVVAYRHLMEDGWEYFDAPTGEDCPKCVPLIVKPGCGKFIKFGERDETR